MDRVAAVGLLLLVVVALVFAGCSCSQPKVHKRTTTIVEELR
jgi:hypothetical protein